MRTILAASLMTLAAGAAVAQDRPPQAGDSYYRAGEAALAQRLAIKAPPARARNVILFVGDGMGVSTLTAARIYAGQKRGLDGESYSLAIDTLPYAALVKTYAHDAQVSDSAPTATALTTGVKTLNDIIGLDQTAKLNDCEGSKAKAVRTLFETAETAGLATGVISTARITHATPAATYAHVANRDWENDSVMPAEARAQGCKDIATQLLDWPFGDGFEVVLGGGRAQFMPKTETDPEYPTGRGLRSDGRDLIAEWRAKHPEGAYVWNKAQFDALGPDARRVLGLFERDHMQYEADRARDGAGEPSLAEMTRKAISLLSRQRKGYVLLVEGGRIDHAHHADNAARALEDADALDQAVKAALEATDPADTLVIVTADHSHTLAINGYPRRGNPILGPVIEVDGQPARGQDGKGYTTLTYGTGPGGAKGERQDPLTVDTTALDYKQQALVPAGAAAHGGEDVEARAVGPSSNLIGGAIEQNVIYHVMRHALGLKDR